MFLNVAYRPTVYKTGIPSKDLASFWHSSLEKARRQHGSVGKKVKFWGSKQAMIVKEREFY